MPILIKIRNGKGFGYIRRIKEEADGSYQAR